MDLALITQDFPPEIGGIETYATELSKRFNQYCSCFFVIAPDRPGAAEVDCLLPYRVHRIGTSNPFLGVNALFEAPPLFKKYNVKNAFHAQWQTLPASVFARMRGQVDSIFVAAHARELLFNPFYRKPVAEQWYEQYKRWMLSEVDCFFPVSVYTAELLRRHGVADNRIEVVINGTDPQKFHAQDRAKARKALGLDAKNILLTITRLVSRKGVDTALKAFKKVLKNCPDSLYVIVGEGSYMPELKKLTEKLEIEDSVQFVGRVPHKNLIDYYNACDVFVMPSKTEVPNVEGFGIVFLEANACEKPVVGTRSGGIPSAVLNGETGILVEENDPAALAGAVHKLFTDADLASQMGRRGRKRVEEEANWEFTAAKVLKHMKDKI